MVEKAKHALDVVFHTTHRRRESCRERPDDGDDEQSHWRQFKEEMQPSDHVNARCHHRRRVDEGADGRRTFHRIGQPDMKGKLRRLADGAHEQPQAKERAEGDAQRRRFVKRILRRHFPAPPRRQHIVVMKGESDVAEIQRPKNRQQR
jgi:hypothetical protein